MKFNQARCRIYVVAYYHVFAMKIESTMVKSKKNQILYYCFTLQCMIQLSIYLSDRHVLLPTYIDINMYTIYLSMSAVRSSILAQYVRARV